MVTGGLASSFTRTLKLDMLLKEVWAVTFRGSFILSLVGDRLSLGMDTVVFVDTVVLPVVPPAIFSLSYFDVRVEVTLVRFFLF